MQKAMFSRRDGIARWRRTAAAMVLFAAMTTGPTVVTADGVTSSQIQSHPGQIFSEKQFCQERLAGNFWMKTELYFGLSKPKGQVTEEEFNNFVDAAVTPRFPDGLTLVRARGQFRDASGAIVEEGSRLLILLYPFTVARSHLADAIREDYKTAFQQESVLRVDEKSCVSF